jgi:hypothetical protein
MLLTRRLKDCHYSVVQFDYSFLLASVSAAVMLTQVIVHLAKGPSDDLIETEETEPYRYPLVFDDWSTYGLCFLDGCLGQLAFSCMIIANQNNNPLLIQLLCYVNVVYSFAADKIVFHSDFNRV